MGRPRKKDRHLPPSIFHKHGAYYLVKKGKWEHLGTDLSTALAEYGRRIEEPKGGCAELIDAAFDAMKARRGDVALSENTLGQYAHAAKRLKKILKNFAPQQVLPRHAAAIKRELAKTPNMANRIMSFGRQVFAYALEHQLVDINPFVGIRSHKEKHRTRLVTQAEYDAIYAAIPPRGQVVMDLLYLTAQRIEDVLNVRTRDLLDEGIAFETDKSKKRIVVRWTPELRAVVDRAKNLHGNVRALTLLHTRKGTPPSYKTVYDQFKRACAKAGIEDTTPHDIRAMAITAVKNQHGKKAAQLIGTHSDERTTDIYLRDREAPIVDGPTMARSA